MTKNIKLKENDLKNIPGVGKNIEQHFFDKGWNWQDKKE